MNSGACFRSVQWQFLIDFYRIEVFLQPQWVPPHDGHPQSLIREKIGSHVHETISLDCLWSRMEISVVYISVCHSWWRFVMSWQTRNERLKRIILGQFLHFWEVRSNIKSPLISLIKLMVLINLTKGYIVANLSVLCGVSVHWGWYLCGKLMSILLSWK